MRGICGKEVQRAAGMVTPRACAADSDKEQSRLSGVAERSGRAAGTAIIIDSPTKASSTLSSAASCRRTTKQDHACLTAAKPGALSVLSLLVVGRRDRSTAH